MNKKDILFYTFLTIFVVTACITLLGILNVVNIREGYLNTLVGVFVVELAGAVITMFRRVDFFTDGENPKNTEAISKLDISTQQHQPKSSGLSVNEYFARIEELENRFAEKEKYIAEINQSNIKGSGFVDSVSTSVNGISIMLTRDHDSGIPEMSLSLPADCTTRAFALHKSDKISFEGVLDTSGMCYWPDIECKTFTLEHI